MFQKIKQWLSIQLVKNTGKIVLIAILVFNIVFFIVAALVISHLSLSGTDGMGFFQAAFYTVSMILDAGCVSYVVSDIGESGVLIAVVCLIIVLIGMISFTGAVIGYVTNFISGYFDRASSVSRKLNLSNHVVILNWNTRASEIINDLLYCERKINVVVLVNSRKAEIEKEIANRLADTVARENRQLWEQYSDLGIRRRIKYAKNKLRNKVTVIIKEGDVFSSKELHDISLEYAKTCIILENDIQNTLCKYNNAEMSDLERRDSSLIIKTLMQVSDITSATYSSDDQKIIVEVLDNWTEELVNSIIHYKQVEGKCNIVPIKVNKILGQILSQFSLMPELNLAYRELFSNKGVTFYVENHHFEKDFVLEYLKKNRHAIPLTNVCYEDTEHAFFAALSVKDIEKEDDNPEVACSVDLNPEYWIEKKKVIICGHNSKCREVMQGFENFRCEWNYKDGNDEILEIIVIDDESNLEKMNYYKEYPFVVKTVPAGIYDKDIICSTIESVVSENEGDTSILILSDDMAPESEIDSKALSNLIYVQDIINEKIKANPDFDQESIDIIVEIIDPKHHDIVSSYSVDNIVISNRYISKMITQIGEKDLLYEFYRDILTYDTDDADGYDSKEIYAKKVNQFFNKIPEECSAYDFIRAVYNASVNNNKPGQKEDFTIALGYVKPGGKIILFGGNQLNQKVKLEEHDKLLVYSNH